MEKMAQPNSAKVRSDAKAFKIEGLDAWHKSASFSDTPFPLHTLFLYSTSKPE
jgi:hypothetical protein